MCLYEMEDFCYRVSANVYDREINDESVHCLSVLM